jgi:AraC-like DNA-binding protein
MDIELTKIAEFVESNLRREFTLQDIADDAGYSPYHFAREYKRITGRSVMEYVRERRLFAAADEIGEGKPVLETALAYGFDTHAGFTRAFSEVIGCTPQEYYRHCLKLKTKGEFMMDITNIKVRLVCKDDVNDLWENVYSAMTPRQITEDKILPSIENYKNQNGFLAVAELDSKAVMTMWVQKLYSSPGFIYDSHYTWQNNEYDHVFEKLLEGAIRFAKQLYMTALCLYEDENSPYVEGFIKGGFKKVFNAGGFDYYMLEI